MTEADVMMVVDVGRLKHHPENPRKGDVTAIAESLQRFGQVKPLIVQRATGYVVAGNHTLKAAKKLKWKTVQILVKDMDDTTALAYLLADNKTSDAGTYDEQNLYELLANLGELEGTGYSVDDLETLADALGTTTVADTDTGEVIRPVSEVANQSINPERTEPMRDIVMLMPQSAATEFGQQVTKLQGAYGTRTVVDTVRRAVADAVGAL